MRLVGRFLCSLNGSYRFSGSVLGPLVPLSIVQQTLLVLPCIWPCFLNLQTGFWKRKRKRFAVQSACKLVGGIAICKISGSGSGPQIERFKTTGCKWCPYNAMKVSHRPYAAQLNVHSFIVFLYDSKVTLNIFKTGMKCFVLLKEDSVERGLEIVRRGLLANKKRGKKKVYPQFGFPTRMSVFFHGSVQTVTKYFSLQEESAYKEKEVPPPPGRGIKGFPNAAAPTGCRFMLIDRSLVTTTTG